MAAAIADLRNRKDELEGPLRKRVALEEARVGDWAQFAHDAATNAALNLQKKKRATAEAASQQALGYLRSLLPAGDPYVRVVGVLAPITSLGRG